MEVSPCPFVLIEGRDTTVTTPSAPLVSCRTSDGRPVLLISGLGTLDEYQVRIERAVEYIICEQSPLTSLVLSL